ncbi:tyrosine-type recombinase/integrase [Deinococcus arenicola]|uniref:Tyrosine-type recombinase/integrase n=1 Tax=Deinococcus arenicola TaxID=2994950 RepID=A0ABU4DVH6_9DEIO|nr:tyrosine-type recombinase/integrase [Deinococcus sp. ZS9-10]MDV6376448.1 tyrosine-type recombinase/integrase [Deinococcus sp. ZS9-10]
MGSVRELPSGSWRWEVMVDGQRHGGTAGSKTLARQAAARLIADATRGGVVDPSAETVSSYLTRWLEGRRPSRATKTHDLQAAHLRLYVAPAIGERRLQKLAPADLRRLYDALNRAGLGAASQRQVHQFLLTALGDALKMELVSRNPATVVKPTPPRDTEERRLPAFTPEEATRFLSAARSDWRGPLFEFALSTGMRRGEVCGLRWIDLDWAASTVRVVENVTDRNGHPHVSTPKTKGSRRTVHLAASTLELLRRVQAAQGEAERIFSNTKGGTLIPGNLKRDMARICGAAGVRELPIHGLRHTYASLSLRRGVPVEVVSKQLGHASAAFTLTQYRHVYESEQASWALGLDDLLTGKI